MAERRPDPTDRRAKLVAITDAGEASLDVANATRERLLTQVFGALSRRQGDVHDGRVQHHHELGDGHDDQDQPPMVGFRGTLTAGDRCDG